MTINEPINDIVTRLYDINWFKNCGEKGANSKYEISYAKDIKSVVKHCSSIRWGNITLQESNDVNAYLTTKRVKTPYTWNEVVLEIKKRIVPRIMERVQEKWNEKYDESEEVTRILRWNVLNILALSAFRDYNNNHFHEELLIIFEQGYFPCGWKGTYPEGKIIIF